MKHSKLSISEGRQLRHYCQEGSATKSGPALLDKLVTGKLYPVKDVYCIVHDIDILKSAYLKIKSKPSSMTSGIDGIDLNALRISDKFFLNLSNSLISESYKPKPTKRVSILKRGPGFRPLGIPTLTDRIVQQSMLFVLEAIFEKTFDNRSHGYRPNRGAHTVCKSIRT
jgi:retron-type reverse transcriptase